MAAVDALESFLSAFSLDEKNQLTNLAQETRSEMSAARIEEARVRIVHEFILSVQRQPKRK